MTDAQKSPDTENWRLIAEAPDYAVSSFGRVKRIRADRLGRGLGKVLRTPLGDKGYPVCSLHVDGKQLHRCVYKLVCTAFSGPKPTPKHEVRHLDGNPLNNRADNLKWGTSAENKADCLRHGTRYQGERHAWAKLTERAVAEIRASKDHFREVAKRYGISPNYVHRIRRADNWKHVDCGTIYR
jgi:hypothetical protein